MSFELDALYVEIRDQARAVAVEMESLAVEADASGELHPGLRAALARSGLWDLVVPATAGGRFERVDPLAVCVVREALMGTSAALDSLYALQGIGAYPIVVGGTAEQRARWLPAVRKGRAIAALAITEPEAGSDLRRISTSLVARDGELILNGRKSFISNAGAADFYSTLVRDGDGLSAVLVPADANGVTVERLPELIAPHVLGDVVFDDVRVGPDARLGTPGQGLDLVLSTLAMFRVSVAGAAVGLAQAALDEAVRHTREREQFGRPLIKLGAVAEMLADSWTEIEMARLLAYRAADRARLDPRAAIHDSSMAKLAATEMAGRVVDRCVQAMGRFGLVRNAKVERLYRQARPMRIYEGASEVLRISLSRELAARAG
jgi:acyl-CoA dehydrogenase